MTATATDRTAELVRAFATTYGREATAGVRAPGRVNLIGEHTDYNDGFCLPMAIERDVRLVYAPREDDIVRVSSLQGEGVADFRLATPIAKDADMAWADYVKGCATVLLEAGIELRGGDLMLSGNVPLGSGLSSSAAIEVAVIHALLALAGKELPGAEIATLAQRGENQYVGTNCGILDQLSSASGMDGKAMLMDCRTLALTPAPLPDGVSVVIADTGKRRGLVDSAYNERRAQCEAGAAALGVSHLRDVTPHGLRAALDDGRIDELAYKRCSFVIAENSRTLAAAACLRAGDVVAFGELMDQSHAGLRDLYEVTCPELDTMCRIARAQPGCLGSRMTGAGFGGCTVSLVEEDKAEAFSEALERDYALAFPDLPVAVYCSRPAPGAGVMPL